MDEINGKTFKTVIIDARTGEPVTQPLEHQGALTAAAFRADGKLIVTASGDGSARVWDATTGQLLLPALEHGRPVVAASFSADGTRLLTASLDRTARIWVLPTHDGTLEEWRALAEQHSPVALANGILVPRRGFRAPDSMPPPGPASAAAVEAPVKRARRRRRTALRSGVGHDPR